MLASPQMSNDTDCTICSVWLAVRCANFLPIILCISSIKSLGGKITIVSEVTKGTKFKIEFEIDKKHEPSYKDVPLCNT